MIDALLAVIGVSWVIGFLLLWRIPRCPSSGAMDAGDVSVIIPARNEEKTLPRLLESLAGQDTRPREIIVVDDHSADASAAVSAAAGARVLVSAGLPEGWLGKSWACWQGARAATGSTFLFLDADTTFEPGGLARVVGAHRLHGGLVTLWPYHRMQRPYEWLSAFFILVVLAGMRAFTILGRRIAPLGAFGPCMICTRNDYFAIGGHERVRGSILEDVDLGRAFVTGRRRVSSFSGRGALSFRMYPDGIGSLADGFGKNMASGAGAASIPLLVLLVAWLGGCGMAAFFLFRALVVVGHAGLPIHIAAYLLFVCQLAWMLSRLGTWPPAVSALFPVPLAFFAALFVRSLVQTFLLRRVTWKGRSIRLPRQGA